MKTLFFSLLLFSSSACAEYQWSAENPNYTQFQIHLAPDPRSIDAVSESVDAWSTGDTYREVTFQILNVIDWGQTRYVAQHPQQCTVTTYGSYGTIDCTEFHESESAWLIGNHPDVRRVDIYMTETAVLHSLISYYLPSKYRSAFQYITIAMKLNSTISNFQLGVKVSL